MKKLKLLNTSFSLFTSKKAFNNQNLKKKVSILYWYKCRQIYKHQFSFWLNSTFNEQYKRSETTENWLKNFISNSFYPFRVWINSNLIQWVLFFKWFIFIFYINKWLHIIFGNFIFFIFFSSLLLLNSYILWSEKTGQWVK